MRSLMDDCVSEIVELISDQIERVKKGKKRRIKVVRTRCLIDRILTLSQNVLLAGGFGASPYLQAKIKDSLALRNAGLRLPDKDKEYGGQDILTYEGTDVSQSDCRRPRRSCVRHREG